MDTIMLILILIQMATTVACPYPRKYHPAAAPMPHKREAEGQTWHPAVKSGVPP